MALDPLELATIAGIIIVFFLWGPQKIPELARMIGRARKEFDNASREFQNAALSIQDGTNPLFAPNPPAAKPGVKSAFPPGSAPAPPPPSTAPLPAKTGDQLLIEAARKLGISTQGKTREQIQEEIVAMAQRSSQGSSSSPPVAEDSAA